MADNIHIASVADGAFENALGGLPPWATEDTALSIEGILRKTLNLQTQALSKLVKNSKAGGGSLNTDEVNDEFDKLVKNLKDENAQHGKDKKHWNDQNNQDKKDKKHWDQENSNVSRKLFLDGMIIKAGLAIKGAFEDNKKTFDALVESGISVMSGMDGAADGFTALRQMTAITGVRFTELAASMQKYSSAVNSFGVGKFAKTIGMASSNLTQFGYSSKESAELLGAMLSVQQGVSDVSQKTAAETNVDLQRFGKSVSRLAIASGMAREKIIENAVAIGHSTDANLLAGQIGNQAAEGMTTFLASFKDQNIAKQILKLMSDPIKPLNESFMNLQKVGLGGFAQSFTQFMKTTEGMPEEVKQQAIKSFIDSHKGELDREKQRLALLKQAGVAEAGAALDLVVGLQQQANAIKKLTPEEIARLEASNKASKDLSNAFEKFKSLLQRAFGPTAAMLNLFMMALTAIIAPIEWVIDGLDWVGKKLSDLSGINMDLAPWIGLAAIGYAMFKSMTVLSAGFDFLKTKLFGGGAKKKAAEWTTSLGADGSGGLVGKGAKGSKGGGLMSGIGDAIGKGIDGIVSTLKKLGDPKVLMGVAALLGISAALYITAKAVTEFGKASWEGLAKAGVALTGLIAILAVVSLGVDVIAVPMVIAAGAIALFAGALWILGAAIESIGAGLTSLSTGFKALSALGAGEIASITLSLMALGAGLALATPLLIAGSVGLIALGAASMLAGPGIALLAWGLKGLADISGAQLAGIGLGIAGLALGLIAATPLLMAAPGLILFGVAAAVAAIPIALLAWGLKSLTEVSAMDLLKVAGSLALFGAALTFAGPLLIAGSVGLIAIGVAALIAAPGLLGLGLAFKLMASGLETLSSVGVSSLIGMAVGLTVLSVALAASLPFLLLAAPGLVLFGLAALVAAPGIALLGYGLKMLSEIDGMSLINFAAGLSALTGDGKLDLMNFGIAAGMAAPGIADLANSLKLLNPELVNSGTTVNGISASLSTLSATLSSFAGLDTLKNIVETINGIDTVKALAIGALAALGVVSLPAAKPTSGPSASASPTASTLNSPSAVSTDPAVGGDQSTGKEQSLPASSGTERGQANDGINTALGYQSSLLEQLLLSTNNLVSVNKDILKYARNSA